MKQTRRSFLKGAAAIGAFNLVPAKVLWGADAPSNQLTRALIEAVSARVAAFRPRETVVLTFAPEFFGSLGFVEVPKTKVMHKLYTGCINCTKHTDPFTCPEIAMVRPVR